MNRRTIVRTALVALAAAALGACRDGRVSKLESQLGELRNETDRLRRDAEDLRRRLPSAAAGAAAPSAPAPAPAGDEARRIEELQALAAGLLEHLSSSGEPVRAGDLHGVWRSHKPEREERAKQTDANAFVEQALHFLPDGRFCGYRINRASGKVPYAGRWQLHGRFVVEMRDEWTGTRNEPRAVVREIAQLSDDGLLLRGHLGEKLQRVAPGDWPPLRSLYEERVAPVSGMPEWCFKEGAK